MGKIFNVFLFFSFLWNFSLKAQQTSTSLQEEIKKRNITDSATIKEFTTFYNAHSIVPVKKATVKKKKLVGGTASSSGSTCDNMDFENGTYNSWDGSTGYNSASNTPPTNIVPGFISNGVNAALNDVMGRHTIVTGNGVDPCGGFPVVAPGGTFSLRLGNSNTGSEVDMISQTFKVVSGQTNLTYKYAIVLEVPSGHDSLSQPYFDVAISDSLGNNVSCSKYYVYADINAPNFFQASCLDVIYRPWTTVNVDLGIYVGQNLTIKFTASDCSFGGHYGYAYIDGSCLSYNLQSDSLCPGKSIQLCAPSGSQKYQWSTSDTSQCITVNTAGTYVVNMVSYTGCQQPVLKHTIKVFNPVAYAGPDTVLCSGNLIKIGSSPSPLYKYHWSPGKDLSDSTVADPFLLTGNAAAVKKLQLKTELGGCSSNYDSVTITLKPSPVVFAGKDTSICGGDSISIGSPPLATALYSWTPSIGLSSATASNPKVSLSNFGQTINSSVYKVTVQAPGYQCSSSDSVKIDVAPHPIADAGLDKVGCSGDTIYLGSASLPLHVYSWSPSTDLYNSNTSAPYLIKTNTGISSALFVYKVRSQILACADSDNVSVVINPVPVSDPYARIAGCDGTSMKIGPTAIPNIGYSWSPGFGLSGTTTSEPILTLTNTNPFLLTDSTDYILTKNYNGSNCTSHDTIRVVVDPHPPVNPGPSQTVCSGTPVNLGGGFYPNFSYEWIPDTYLSAKNQAFTVGTFPLNNTASAKIYNYKLKVSINSCVDSGNVSISVYPTPKVDAGPDMSVCNGNLTKIGTSGDPGVFYQWSPSFGLLKTDTTLATVNYANNTNIPVKLKYYLSGISQTNCVNKDSVYVTINPTPVVYAGPDTTVCYGDEVNFAPTGATTYTWVDLGNQVVFTNNGSGNESAKVYNDSYFRVKGIDQNGCSDVDSLRLFVKPLPVADFQSSDKLVFIENPIEVRKSKFTSDEVNYIWSFGDSTYYQTTDKNAHPSHKYQAPGHYLLKLASYNSLGCVKVDTMPILVVERLKFYVPNVFTPNGDKINDVFGPVLEAGTFINFEMFIYDRWGNQVFHTTDYSHLWDGRANNGSEISQNDVYTYLISITDNLGRSHDPSTDDMMLGKVTLLR